ncbi:MAG: lipopolysaccharide biosynthesis protein [Prevotellaceae bacterium]|nr:lipopolysaccharide biosynthesis protein [Candidatus Faecinaster equi]
MPDNTTNNKTIAKNTVLLYMRMFFTIIIGLYTSRVILQGLGITDYGIYNLVGGIVSMLAFLNVGMTGASQRFISYELGKGSLDSLKNVFCTSILTHNTIAVIGILAFETIGLWLVNYKLVIPSERLYAANIVFQCSIITFAVSTISIPYNACLVAHEKMGQFAYISMLETILKLGVALLITVSPFDKLILYAVLILCIQILIRLLYSVYCKKHFEECSYKFHFDKSLYKEMFSFAGWGCVGNMGFSLKDQLSNIILNLFFGTTVNAARGVATQVNGIINGFAMNFTMAMNPQITKQYAAGNIDRSKSLAISGSKYAFFLLSMVVIPFIINEKYVLRLWLGEVPEYTDAFVCIILIASCIYSMTHTISSAIIATGRVKVFQSLLAITLLLEAPIAYVILKLGGAPYMALLPCIFTNFLSIILRIVILHNYLPQYSIREYLLGIVTRCLLIFIIAFALSYYVHSLFNEGIGTVLLTSTISVIICALLMFFIGLDRREKEFIISKILKKKKQ